MLFRINEIKLESYLESFKVNLYSRISEPKPVLESYLESFKGKFLFSTPRKREALESYLESFKVNCDISEFRFSFC